MYFCIRDDDTSFFTTPEELERIYGEITKWGPVSLAVIPFCRAGMSKGVPDTFRGKWSTHPLDKNQALVEYLRCAVSDGRFEIMLHGYHHDEPSGRGEFLQGRDLENKVREGREYLEKLLGTTIRVFVAPRNIIGRDGLRAIVRAGLHFGGTVGLRHGWPVLAAASWRNWAKLRKWRKDGSPAIPWVLDLGDHREIPGNPVTPSSVFIRNKAAFEKALELGGAFCVATHYWELSAQSKHPGDPPVGEHLHRLIHMARTNRPVLWRSVGDVICNSKPIA